MRLSDVDIEQKIASGDIIIDPPPGDDAIAGISVDLRLDHRFRVFNNNSVTHLDLSGDCDQLNRDIDRMRIISHPANEIEDTHVASNAQSQNNERTAMSTLLKDSPGVKCALVRMLLLDYICFGFPLPLEFSSHLAFHV